jgi:hypothetical protein
MVNDYSSGREACQAKITCTQRWSWLLGLSALDATKWPDINFQTKSVWFDPKFFSWAVRARPGVVPGRVSWVSMFLDVQCAPIGLQNRSDEVNERTSSQNAIDACSQSRPVHRRLRFPGRSDPPGCELSMCSSWWRSGQGASRIARSSHMQRRPGPCSSFAKRFRAIILTVS